MTLGGNGVRKNYLFTLRAADRRGGRVHKIIIRTHAVTVFFLSPDGVYNSNISSVVIVLMRF